MPDQEDIQRRIRRIVWLAPPLLQPQLHPPNCDVQEDRPARLRLEFSRDALAARFDLLTQSMECGEQVEVRLQVHGVDEQDAGSLVDRVRVGEVGKCRRRGGSRRPQTCTRASGCSQRSSCVAASVQWCAASRGRDRVGGGPECDEEEPDKERTRRGRARVRDESGSVVSS